MAEGGNVEQQVQDLIAAGINAALVELGENLQVDLQGQLVRRRRIPSPTPAEALGLEVYRELDWEEEYVAYANLMRSSILNLEAMDNNNQGQQVAHHLDETLMRARQFEYRENQLEADVLRLVRDANQHLPVRTNDEHHAYSSIYLASYAYRGVLVKECTNFSYSRAMLDREIAMSARFVQATIPILSLKLTNSHNLFKLGVQYFRNSLDTLMRNQHQCEVVWNIAGELFRVMSYFETANHLLRDFRLESFRVEESKSKVLIKVFIS